MPTAIRRYAAGVQRRSSTPTGMPITPPSTNGSRRGQAEPAPQFPHGVTLHDQAESHDQGGRLQWRQHMQPDRRRDQAEGEAGHAGDQGRAEGRADEERQVE